MLELSDELRARLERVLAPYAAGLVERSAGLALRLHADEVGTEHLVCALMEDEECAAHRLVLSAFADPETLADEVRALAAGILVTGSAASLPFSEGGVRALEDGRATAIARREACVRPDHLLAAAVARLASELALEVEAAGYEARRLAEGFAAPAAAGAVPETGSLFKAFSEEAKRVLSAAAKVTREAGDGAIGPAHLILACLSQDGALAGRSGLSLSRARVLLRGRTQDPTPLRARALAPDEVFATYLAELPEGSPGATGSLDLLARLHTGRTPELAQVLVRHRVTPALLERSAGAFLDPET